MARKRQSSKANSSTKQTHTFKLRELSRAGVSVDPTNKRSVSRAFNKLQDARIPESMLHKVPGKSKKSKSKAADELKAHGYRVQGNRVVIDGPRDKRRNPIKGSKVEVMRGGVIKTSVGKRRDFIYGFTKKEKKEFAKNPGAFEKKKIAELRKKYPLLKHARKLQTRLQWGAYQATKDFAPNYFTAKYFATVSPEEIRKKGKKKARPRADKLTGLHIVIHTPSTARKRRKRKNGKGRKKK